MIVKTIRYTPLLLAVAVAQVLTASSLSISARHDVVVTEDENRQLTRVVFTDEPLAADVTLNVYELEFMPSTRVHREELLELKKESWLDEVTWTLTSEDGRTVTLPYPRVLSNRVRQRGPDAARPADRDTAVPMTTYQARVLFRTVDPGDYVLKASVRGLNSTFHFVIRTGRESGMQDHYLRLKAMRTRDYAEFRRLQLERLELDPLRADALFALIDRALERGTLEETRSYFERAIVMSSERRRAVTDPAALKRMEAGSERLRAVQRALPEYFANRASRTLARDLKDGHYVMRHRTSGAVIRDFGPAQSVTPVRE